MEKVKITQEQANSIEYVQGYHLEEDVIKAHTGAIDWALVGNFKGLNKLPLYKLVKALYIGYEVEPEFVSFEEAMKALKEAKAVYFHDEEWKTRVTYGAFLEDTDIAGYTLVGLINGKWSIGRENK